MAKAAPATKPANEGKAGSEATAADTANGSTPGKGELSSYTPVKGPVIKRRPDAALTGGATPEALGHLILRALQTNNKKLWISCIHPDIGTATPYDIAGIMDSYTNQFDRARKYFEEHGMIT